MIYVLLWAFLIPVSVAAFFYFLGTHKVPLAVGSICLALVFVAVALFQYSRISNACLTDSGELVPGKFTTAQTIAEQVCHINIPNNFAAIVTGPNPNFVGKDVLRGQLTILAISDHPVVSLEFDQNGLYVDADLYDTAGAPLARVERNRFSFASAVFCSRPDLSTFAITNWYGKELLYVRYLSADAVEVRGVFNYPNGRSVRITKKDFSATNVHHFNSSCNVSGAGAFRGLFDF